MWLTRVLESPPPPPPLRRYFKFRTSLRVSSQPPTHPTNSRGIPGGRLPLLNLNFSLKPNWKTDTKWPWLWFCHVQRRVRLTLFQKRKYRNLFLTCWQDVGDMWDRCCRLCWPPAPCLETILLPYSSGSPCMKETSYKRRAKRQKKEITQWAEDELTYTQT